MQETGPTVYSLYPRRLECLTVCRYNYKGSTFSSVILRPPECSSGLGLEPSTSHTADWRSTNWANQAAVMVMFSALWMGMCKSFNDTLKEIVSVLRKLIASSTRNWLYQGCRTLISRQVITKIDAYVLWAFIFHCETLWAYSDIYAMWIILINKLAFFQQKFIICHLFLGFLYFSANHMANKQWVE